MPETNETALEKTFSDLAYTHLRDQSQALLDYLVGFQMLKQEDDGQRAVGIFGFEIDGDYYYAPIFFLNGEIRGLDSLYSVKSDLFMPLTDDWVNTIINRRQISLGDKDRRSRTERGVGTPNYTRLKIIPGGGGNTNLKLAQSMMGARDDYETLSLPEGLKMAGLLGHFKEAMGNNPRFAKAIQGAYSPMDFVDTPAWQPNRENLTEIKPRLKTAQEEPVIIISTITDAGTDQLTDEQRKEVLAGGTVVIDNRPEVAQSQLFSTEAKEVLENPTGGGLYDVLMSDGTTALCLIAGDSSDTDVVNVYCPSLDKCTNIKSCKVFVTRKYDREALIEWLKENGRAASDCRPGEAGIFVSPSGVGTAGFEVFSKRTGVDGITVCDIKNRYLMNGCFHCSPGPLGTNSRGDNGNPPHNTYMDLRLGGDGDKDILPVSQRPEDPNDRVDQLLICTSGSEMPRYTEDKCIINDKCFYFVKLDTFSLDPKKEYEPISFSERKDKFFSESDFGNYTTVRAALDKLASDIKLWKTGSDITIKLAEDGSRVTTKYAGALTYLIKDLGLGEGDARNILKEAEVEPTVRYKVRKSPKTAAELLVMPEVDDRTYGNEMSQYHDAVIPFTTATQRQSEDNREFYRYFSQFGDGGGEGYEDTLATVETAAKVGDKNVFDAAALGSLIKTHTPTDLVDRFLPTITSGMDRIGRMLFLIYWHYEDFEERYGENDLSEFIDNLRSVFEQMGDVVIFAKKKTLAGDPEHYGMGVQPVMEEAS